MKTLVFSDTHLGTSFDKRKFTFLKRIINSADRVIINGDFWEGFDMSFSEFVKSPWSKLFPLLLKKKTVYVYGNHDAKKLCSEEVNLFSTEQTKLYQLKVNGTVYFFEHGDRIVPLVDAFFRKYFKTNPPSFLNRFYESCERFFVKKFGKKYLKLVYHGFNNKIKKYLKTKSNDNHYYVFGHTHLAEHDKKIGFLNTGIIKHGFAQYILIDEKGRIAMNEEWYDLPK